MEKCNDVHIDLSMTSYRDQIILKCITLGVFPLILLFAKVARLTFHSADYNWCLYNTSHVI